MLTGIHRRSAPHIILGFRITISSGLCSGVFFLWPVLKGRLAFSVNTRELLVNMLTGREIMTLLHHICISKPGGWESRRTRLWRARSRLYPNRFSQINTHFVAFRSARFEHSWTASKKAKRRDVSKKETDFEQNLATLIKVANFGRIMAVFSNFVKL